MRTAHLPTKSFVTAAVTLALFACADLTISPPAADAGTAASSSTDPKAPIIADHRDASPNGNFGEEAMGEPTNPLDASIRDANGSDAPKPRDASTSDAGAGDASLQITPATELFLPEENDVPYELVAECTTKRIKHVGLADSCCRSSSDALKTKCDTVLREERNLAGDLVVIVAPLKNCVDTPYSTGCSMSGNAARCGPAGGCPGPAGGRHLISDGTYARRMMRNGTVVTPTDHYWTCSDTFLQRPTPMFCDRMPSGAAFPASLMTTLSRIGPGQFEMQQSWDNGRAAPECASPSPAPAAPTLAETTFGGTTATPMGGTYEHLSYTCTYKLTRK